MGRSLSRVIKDTDIRVDFEVLWHPSTSTTGGAVDSTTRDRILYYVRDPAPPPSRVCLGRTETDRGRSTWDSHVFRVTGIGSHPSWTVLTRKVPESRGHTLSLSSPVQIDSLPRPKVVRTGNRPEGPRLISKATEGSPYPSTRTATTCDRPEETPLHKPRRRIRVNRRNPHPPFVDHDKGPNRSRTQTDYSMSRWSHYWDLRRHREGPEPTLRCHETLS